jgi:tetratricopeptide (TPR) repeat protein
MKQITTSLLILLSFAACNNAVNEQPVTQQQIPAQEKEMKDAIAKFPDSMLLREILIQYYQDNGNYDLAIAETNKVLQKDSANMRFLNRKADLLYLDYDTLNAIKVYEKSIEIFPDPKIIISLGICYAQAKNPNALVMADALLIGKNAHAEKEAFFIKGLYYSYISEKQKAIPFFDKCLDLDYTYLPGYLEKGVALYDMKRYEEALLVFDRAVTVQNIFDEGYYWLGRCYEKMKDNNAAIDNYRTALLYNPDYVEAKDALGKLGVK